MTVKIAAYVFFGLGILFMFPAIAIGASPGILPLIMWALSVGCWIKYKRQVKARRKG